MPPRLLGVAAGTALEAALSSLLSLSALVSDSSTLRFERESIGMNRWEELGLAGATSMATAPSGKPTLEPGAGAGAEVRPDAAGGVAPMGETRGEEPAATIAGSLPSVADVAAALAVAAEAVLTAVGAVGAGGGAVEVAGAEVDNAPPDATSAGGGETAMATWAGTTTPPSTKGRAPAGAAAVAEGSARMSTSTMVSATQSASSSSEGAGKAAGCWPLATGAAVGNVEGTVVVAVARVAKAALAGAAEGALEEATTGAVEEAGAVVRDASPASEGRDAAADSSSRWDTEDMPLARRSSSLSPSLTEAPMPPLVAALITLALSPPSSAASASKGLSACSGWEHGGTY